MNKELFICTWVNENWVTKLPKDTLFYFDKGALVSENQMYRINCGTNHMYRFNQIMRGEMHIAPYNPSPKDLLTVGRVVELRDGIKGFVLPDRIIAKDGWINLKNYDENCNDSTNSEYDIVEIYDAPINNRGEAWNLRSSDKECLNLVWKREEKSKEQIEKEAIQIEMEKLAKRLSELEVK